MSNNVVTIGYGILWVVIGACSAFLSMLSIKSSAEKITSKTNTGTSLVLLSGVAIRMLFLAALMYLAIRMNVIYALLLVAAFTVVRFILIVRLSKKNKQDANYDDCEKP